MVGHTLLHYKILTQLGQGGMGAVYKARDKRLLRHVAIKLLRPELMIDRNKRLRFIKEAQTASSLNHPNICTIHDIVEDNEQHFIVMELVDGKNLREILNERGPIPEPELISIVLKICEALSIVHAKGISHRDIKPENIMITGNGLVKVMDFGLAKLATEFAESTVGMEASEDWRKDYIDSMAVTNLSGLLGTVHYMSPEQAQGQKIDHRTDIFSLGVMLIELLTGEKPVKGNTNLDILKKIITEPIQLDCHSQYISVILQSILSRALEKNPDDRYQNINELLEDLKKLNAGELSLTSDNEDSEKESSTPKTFTTSNIIGGTLIVTLIAILIRLYFAQTKSAANLPPMQTYRFTSYPGEEYDPVFSPDGEYIAFCWNGEQEDNFDIYRKKADGGDPIRLTTNKEDEIKPAWSPDGSLIAFQRNISEKPENKKLYIIPSSGGLEQEIIEFMPGINIYDKISWSVDGKYIYYRDFITSDKKFVIYQVSIETRESIRITSVPPNALADFHPVISPNGAYLAFWRISPPYSDLYTQKLTNNNIRRVIRIQSEIEGFCWDKNNKSILFAANLDGTSALWKTSIQNSHPEKLISGVCIQCPDYSPVKNRLVYQETVISSNIWKIDLQNPENEELLISSSMYDHNPDISPDGKKILFSSNRTGTRNVWMCNRDGSNQIQLTFFNNYSYVGYNKWSPDGNTVLVDIGGTLYFINTSDGKKHELKINFGMNPTWSKDGNGIIAAPYPEMKLYFYSIDGKIQKPLTEGSGITPKIYGNYIYYMKHLVVPDIWRISLDGKNEEPVLQGVRDLAILSWDIVKNGIYFFRTNNNSPVLCFYDFNTKQICKIREIPLADIEFLTIHIDPDERYLLYTKHEPDKSDIILVENFSTE